MFSYVAAYVLNEVIPKERLTCESLIRFINRLLCYFWKISYLFYAEENEHT